MSESEGLYLPDDFVRRMRNWARAGSGCGPGMVRAMDYGAVIDGGYREAELPTLNGEAMDTDEAIRILPMRYRQAVQQYWRYEGRTWRWHGNHRGVHHETFRVWLIKGHELLRPELARRTEAHHARALSNSQIILRRGLIPS